MLSATKHDVTTSTKLSRSTRSRSTMESLYDVYERKETHKTTVRLEYTPLDASYTSMELDHFRYEIPTDPVNDDDDRRGCKNEQKQTLSPTPSHQSHDARSVEPPSDRQLTKKRQRYLRDVDRRTIIQRIENGEKQATLAREFGVTRAAICHIKKNRDEIITRYDLLVQSAKELEKAGMFGSSSTSSASSTEPAMVQELMSRSAQLLISTLRSTDLTPRAFRVTANRVLMMLLEEAIASVPSDVVDVQTARGDVVEGHALTESYCGVAIGAEGVPFVQLLEQIEPDVPIGYLHMRRRVESPGGPSVSVVDRVDLPRSVSSQSIVLLFVTTVTSSASLCSAVKAIRDVGIPDANIRVVMVATTQETVTQVHSAFPNVRVLAASIERASAVDDLRRQSMTSLGDFLHRYHQVKQTPRHDRQVSQPSQERHDHSETMQSRQLEMRSQRTPYRESRLEAWPYSATRRR